MTITVTLDFSRVQIRIGEDVLSLSFEDAVELADKLNEALDDPGEEDQGR